MVRFWSRYSISIITQQNNNISGVKLHFAVESAGYNYIFMTAFVYTYSNLVSLPEHEFSSVKVCVVSNAHLYISLNLKVHVFTMQLCRRRHLRKF